MYSEQKEAELQKRHGRQLSINDSVPEENLTGFIETECDWVLLAGNRITMKVAQDRYSKRGGYITQRKLSGKDDRPITEYHDTFVDAVDFAKETIRKGKNR